MLPLKISEEKSFPLEALDIASDEYFRIGIRKIATF
jgi:hypothetical protein